MKKILLTLAGTLILAACAEKTDSAKTTEKPAKSKTEQSESGENQGLKIAYVRMDSLVENYDHHKELREAFETEVSKMERDMDRKAKDFEENVKVLEREAQRLSERELQMHQAELQQRYQMLLQEREEKLGKLAEREKDLNKLLKEEVDQVLSEIREEEDYDFIFSYEPGGQLLAMKESYDITPQVSIRLNENHKQRKDEKDSKDKKGSNTKK